MNDQGAIKTFKNDEEAKAAGYNTPLTEDEAQNLKRLSEDERQIELLWIKFWQNQQKFRTPTEKNGMRHAFITGAKVMVALINN